MFDAIYTRQSVDKLDSISTESQEELCRKEVSGQPIKVYTDKGYSGKNTDRPAFQEMMRDVENGKINRVVVYRLDRISRSVLDFARIIDVFQKHNVDFISTMEKFDTGTPIGKAMLMIVMIFAQLERETIQQRVIDAYVSRSRRGFYMGGRIPLGFRLKDIEIDGIHTKCYETEPHEAEIIKTAFDQYSEPQTSLGDVMYYLRQQKMVSKLGHSIGRARVRDIIINPVYVKADLKMYEFFKSQGVEIVNPPEDWIGTNGAYLYSGTKKSRKTVSLAGHVVVLAPHEGIVDSDVWLKCRKKCLSNQQVAKPVKAKATWLAGRIKCPCCGYALTSKTYHCKTKADNRYYLCTRQHSDGLCKFGSVDADVVDAIVLDEMRKKLTEFEVLSKQEAVAPDIREIKLKDRLAQIETEITSLLDKVLAANETVMAYINNKVAELDAEKQEILTQLDSFVRPDPVATEVIRNYMDHWDELEMADKLTVVGALIQKVVPSKTKVEITWRF